MIKLSTDEWSETAMGNRHNGLPPLRERLAWTAADERREKHWSRTSRAIGEYCDQRDTAYASRDIAWESLVTWRVASLVVIAGLVLGLIALMAGCIESGAPGEADCADAGASDAAPDATPIDCEADCIACHSSDYCFPPADAATVPDAPNEADGGPVCGKVGLPCCAIFNPDGAPLPWCGSGTPTDVDGACACVSAEDLP